MQPLSQFLLGLSVKYPFTLDISSTIYMIKINNN